MRKLIDLSPISFFTKVLVIFAVILLSATSCNLFSSKKFPHNGGTFVFALENEPSTFLVREVKDLYSATLINQVYEGLVRLNTLTLDIEPGLAKSFQISKNGKTLQFVLRDDVYFHTKKGESEKIKLSPEDVVFSIELACTPIGEKEPNAYSVIYKNQLKGAVEFFEGQANTIDGITISGDTITLELVERNVNFIEKLAQAEAAILSKKITQLEGESSLRGTGPFKFIEYREQNGKNSIVFSKNENYYGRDEMGYQLPYLDSLIMVIENKPMSQLELFEKGKIQFIDGLPPSQISTILGEGKIKDFNSTPPKLILVRKPLLVTHYFYFDFDRPEFQDIRVRRAFNYAINRELIVHKVLNNQAYEAGNLGIVPPDAFSGYDARRVQQSSYNYQPDKARSLLAQAGYLNGKGFPSITINSSLGVIPSAVADEVARQLERELNINVNLEAMPFQELINDDNEDVRDLTKSAWVADYYSPESFLINGYSKNSPTNFGKYKNPEFDRIIDKARGETNIIEQYEYFALAEEILMRDAPFIILWYEETIKIVNSNVRNLFLNEMNNYSFREVYFKEWTKKEWEIQLER